MNDGKEGRKREEEREGNGGVDGRKERKKREKNKRAGKVIKETGKRDGKSKKRRGWRGHEKGKRVKDKMGRKGRHCLCSSQRQFGLVQHPVDCHTGRWVTSIQCEIFCSVSR